MNHSKEISLRQLRYLTALADDLHFAKAAARLGISQPSLTRQIQAMEKIVGAALVERTQRVVALTPTGATLAERARVTLSYHDESLAAARNIAARKDDAFSIGFECCAPYHDFWEVVSRFVSRYPRTRLTALQMSGAELAEALLRNEIDAGFVHPPVPDHGLLSFEKVADDRFVAVLPKGHRLASRRRFKCSELASEKFALYPRTLAPSCYDAVQAICKAAGFVPDVVHETNEISVSLSLISEAKVVTILPACVKTRPAPGVVFREIEGKVVSVACGLIVRAGEVPVAVARFLKMWRSIPER